MTDVTGKNVSPSEDDQDKQPRPAADRAVSSTDPAEGAALPAEERGGPAAD